MSRCEQCGERDECARSCPSRAGERLGDIEALEERVRLLEERVENLELGVPPESETGP